jgi:hypothetical protein
MGDIEGAGLLLCWRRLSMSLSLGGRHDKNIYRFLGFLCFGFGTYLRFGTAVLEVLNCLS